MRRKRFAAIPPEENPLVKLEQHVDVEDDWILRQVGFCAQWSLDNLFPVPNRLGTIIFMLSYPLPTAPSRELFIGNGAVCGTGRIPRYSYGRYLLILSS